MDSTSLGYWRLSTTLGDISNLTDSHLHNLLTFCAFAFVLSGLEFSYRSGWLLFGGVPFPSPADPRLSVKSNVRYDAGRWTAFDHVRRGSDTVFHSGGHVDDP